MPELTDKQHTLYITHGGPLTLKGLTRRLNPNDYHWVVIYKYLECVYELHPLTTVNLNNGDGLLISDVSQVRFSSHHELIKFISSYTKKIHTIALDANLTEVGGEHFSQVTHDIVILTECEEALFFTDTPPCHNDAENYISYQHPQFKPPLTLKRARVSTRAGLSVASSSLFDEIDHPIKAAEDAFTETVDLMIFKPERRGHHSLCITRADVSTLKFLMSKLSPNEHLWVVFYDKEEKYYYLHHLTTVTLYDQSGLLVRDVSVFQFSSHCALVEFIGCYAESIRDLIIDANLFNETEDLFSEIAHDILVLTQCEEVVFLIESASCQNDTEKYLDYRHDTLKPPLPLKRAQIFMQTASCSARETVFIQVNHLNQSTDDEAQPVTSPIKNKPKKSYFFWSSSPSPERPKKICCCFPISFSCKSKRIASDVQAYSVPAEDRKSSITSYTSYTNLRLLRKDRRAVAIVDPERSDFEI